MELLDVSEKNNKFVQSWLGPVRKKIQSHSLYFIVTCRTHLMFLSMCCQLSTPQPLQGP